MMNYHLFNIELLFEEIIAIHGFSLEVLTCEKNSNWSGSPKLHSNFIKLELFMSELKLK